MALYKVSECKEPKARKQEKNETVFGWSQTISVFYSPLYYNDNYLFHSLPRFLGLHKCRLTAEPGWGSHRSPAGVGGEGEHDWQLTGWYRTKAGRCSRTLRVPTATYPFPVFVFCQKKTLGLLWFVLFCFSYRPCCQLGPEATMNINYRAGQRLINVNNMHGENLSDEKPTYIFSGCHTECKWLWKI